MSTIERYYICTFCGHYWSSPYPPANRRCENCARVHATISRMTLDAAEDASERALA